MIENESAEVKKQLLDTVEWCQNRSNPKDPEHSLRSSAIRPRFEDYSCSARSISLNPQLIREVVEQRRQVLTSSTDRLSKSFLTKEKGKLLLCAYEYTNHNGATATLTKYFFDEMDVPPWDTWIGEINAESGSELGPAGNWVSAWPPTLSSTLDHRLPSRRLLFCWIPSLFIPIVDKAISVECVGMLSWVDEPIAHVPAGPDFGVIIPTWVKDLASELPR